MVTPGLELCRRYYFEAVAPLLREHFGDLPHSAALIGTGSEVLGFDTERSADHEWGPRFKLFTRDRHAGITAMLADKLPKTFLGYPTNFAPTENEGVRYMTYTDGPVHHRVEVADLREWLTRHLGFDPDGPIDWLDVPTQTLLEVTAGEVFHDGLDELEAARAKLAWYPTDVWRQVLAREWRGIADEEAFVGRCGEVGDELGSAVVAARIVRHLMCLCLFMARKYPPYSKWLGSAFARLPVDLPLREVLAATDWKTRERYLTQAYEIVAALHNGLGLTAPLDTKTRLYHDRPFQVLMADRFAEALTGA
ncbi:DUF4037 domain-containing protein [Actinocrispum wychmicini]|uniref:Uncharacterized protein DUF4037 n=1 Tax=Actinocrispum wychmicini TaxID=1213861 RepID=A0A4R2J0U9_9PSEU|nr:DUF4037 domain-containing protein [Actinocrispum wychmicini]TCO48885.1 uncharacterized protein DUF4037 [Actinocrispum wychmicini]